MAKRERIKTIIWGCIAAALLLAVALFLLLPRRADKLIKAPDASAVYGIVLSDTVVTPDLIDHFQTGSYTTRDASLVQEMCDLLRRTKLYFGHFNGGVQIYDNPINDGQLCTLYLWSDDTSVKDLTLRPDGAVFVGNVTYEIRDEAVLAEYMALLEKIKASFLQGEPDPTAMDDDQLAEYQALFDAPSWYAQAVAAPFTDRGPDLNAMFYDGLSFDATGAPVYGGYVTPADGDEWAWVRENVPGAAEVDVSRLPRQGMLQVLRDTVYGSAGIPEGLAPQGWTYWDETDCWYHAHGDTGIYSVALLSGQWTGEGTGTLRFQGLLGQTYQISFTLGQTEQDAGHLYLRACVSAD